MRWQRVHRRAASISLRLQRARNSAQPTVGSRPSQMTSTAHPAAATTHSTAAAQAAAQAWAATPSSGAAHGARRSGTNATTSMVPLLKAELSCQQLQLALSAPTDKSTSRLVPPGLAGAWRLGFSVLIAIYFSIFAFFFLQNDNDISAIFA